MSSVSDPNDLSQQLREAAAGPLAQPFPARWLDEHAVLPLALVEQAGIRTVHVAAATALPSDVADLLARRLRATLTFRIVPAGEIRAAIVAAPRREGGDVPTNTPTPLDDVRRAGTSLDGDSVASLDDLQMLATREPVIQVVNAMLGEAVRADASDVHLEATASGLRVRMRRDGVLQDVQLLADHFTAGVVSRLKVMAGLDIAERRLPQDGRARVQVDGREIDVRVATVPAIHGESLVLRLLDSGGTRPRSLAALGIAPATRAAFAAQLARSSGLLLVTGPTGSGKTTTLYAALAERSTPAVKVVTVEDPVEYRLDGVVQLPVNPKAGFDFANALRAILRHDPDVILVGEMRDAATAEMAVQAALTGHLVLSTLHTTDAASAVVRLTDMGIPPYLIAATLQGVLAQRLVRLTCQHCGEWHPLEAKWRAMAAQQRPVDAPPIERQRVGAGCPTCRQTGYQGRAAITEFLPLDESLRRAIVEGVPLDALRAMARRAGVPSLTQDGWQAVAEGRTTVLELVRVLTDADAS